MGCPFHDLEYRLSTAFELPMSTLVYPLGSEPLPHARATVPCAARCAVGALQPHKRRSIAAWVTCSVLAASMAYSLLLAWWRTRPGHEIPHVPPSGPA
jgi:hypothetical protein